MNGTHNKFLARACLPEVKYGRITRSHSFDQLQHPSERRTHTHDSFKVSCCANLVFMEFLLGERVSKFGDLSMG
jgi:hypothetical protein